MHDIGITYIVLPAEADVAGCEEVFWEHCTSLSFPEWTKAVEGPGHAQLQGRRASAIKINDFDYGTGICTATYECARRSRPSGFVGQLAAGAETIEREARDALASFPDEALRKRLRQMTNDGADRCQLFDFLAAARIAHGEQVQRDKADRQCELALRPARHLQYLIDKLGPSELALPHELWRILNVVLRNRLTPWVGLACMRSKNTLTRAFRPEVLHSIDDVSVTFLAYMDADMTWHFKL
jgi:hypothetical protein